jgi:hypothetical protein
MGRIIIGCGAGIGSTFSTYGLNQYKNLYGGEITPYYDFNAALTLAARFMVASKPIIKRVLKRFKGVQLLLETKHRNH